MRTKIHSRTSAWAASVRRALAVLLVLCLLMSHLNFGYMVTYATGGGVRSFQVGESVTAELAGGVLTLTGTGESFDYGPDTAPFADAAGEIHTLVVEEGITYLGAYLFYGLGGLSGELTLPGSLTGFGEQAFSGPDAGSAPRFSLIRNEFTSAEVPRAVAPADTAEPEPGPGAAPADTAQPEPGPGSAPADTAQPEPTPSVAPEDTARPEPEPSAAPADTARPEPEPSAAPADTAQPEPAPSAAPADTTQPEPEPGEAPEPSAPRGDGGDEGGAADGEPSDVQAAAAALGMGPFRRPVLAGAAAPELPRTEAGEPGGEEGGADAAGSSGSDGTPSEPESAPPEEAGPEESGAPVPTTEPEQSAAPAPSTEPEESAAPVPSTEPEESAAPVPSTEPEESATPVPSAEPSASAPPDGGGPSQGGVEPPEYQVERITEQVIAVPETLFFGGQTGVAVCSDENGTFIAAALAAGYQIADGLARLTLDGAVTLEVPTVDGQARLPECPEELAAAHGEDAFFTYTFAGWTRADGGASAPVLAAGEFLEVPGGALALTSVWNAESKYKLTVEMARTGDGAVYTLVEEGSGGAMSAPEGYALAYQWQLAEPGGEEPVWTEIPGAVEAAYARPILPEDGGRRLRCAVTAHKLARSAGGSVVLYSDPADAAVVVKTVYVDQENGDDAKPGTETEPVKTFDGAAKLLTKKADGGTVESNRVVLVGTYKLAAGANLFSGDAVPVTVTGGTLATVTKENEKAEWNLFLQDDLLLKEITVSTQDTQGLHIYASGHDFTAKEEVNGKLIYLYGSNREAVSGKLGTEVGKIAVYSGSYTRIVGYIRSASSGIDAENKEANITIGGTAKVSNVMAGTASGGVQNASVNINIEGGSVTTVAGGNHGFSASIAPYSGTTTIRVSGGTVENILGAGKGRNTSVPTFEGTLAIQVTGGTVGNIYGGGSAAYVVSPEGGTPSQVHISVTGGTVGDIFAAGIGGDPEINGTVSGDDLGSLTGEVDIDVSGPASVNNIYASGSGFVAPNGYTPQYETTKNAYLNGTAKITVGAGATVENVFCGGKGITTAGYEDCARVTEGSAVALKVAGNVMGSVYGGGENARVDGTATVLLEDGAVVGGNVYGGGKSAEIKGSASVSMTGGTVAGNVYGGGEHGLVRGKTRVHISGGTVDGSVYGGALGETGSRMVLGGSTVNMTGGWVKGNLYGGSELSDDGLESVTELAMEGLVFVNLTGGVVDGNVFGGGYRGVVNGSTHLHIGEGSMAACAYYGSHTDEKPNLDISKLTVEGSVYAGGDYGGGATIDYNSITVKGTSHVYIDGTGYDTGGSGGGPEMTLGGGVFGSGASCDAGSTRLVTLKNYGHAVETEGVVTGATRTLSAIQRADRVLLIGSHVELTGKSDLANPNQTALYSLNRVGDKGVRGSIPQRENGLVLQGGSTVVLDSAVMELANFKSADADGEAVAETSVKDTHNTVRFDSGTVFRVSYTGGSGEVYGAVTGYAYMLASDTANAYAYARIAQDGDGGFVDKDGKVLDFTNVGNEYRYWQMKGKTPTAFRQTVLTAQTLTAEAAGLDTEGYAVAEGVIELPHSNESATYTIESVALPGGTGLTLVDAAKVGMPGGWVTSQANGTPGTDVNEEEQKTLIKGAPLTHFGLYMRVGAGFQGAGTDGKVVSTESAKASGKNSIVNHVSPSTNANSTPEIAFYLTYWNEGITASKSLGTVEITLTGSDNTTVVMEVEIVTKASALSDQTVDLYATQGGGYTGKLIIPAGDSRKLSLTGVTVPESASLVAAGTSVFSGNQFAVTMQPVKSQGWNTAGLMTEPYDLHAFQAATSQNLGTTDSRYQAEVAFTLYNAPNFQAKETPDSVVLTLHDDEGDAKITLNIHWEESVVTGIVTAPGRRYNGVAQPDGDVTISGHSAFTTAFTLKEGAVSAADLWLELQTGNGGPAALPVGTELTLFRHTGDQNQYYHYTVAEAETEDGRIPLSSFRAAGGAAALSGALGGNLTVITDLGPGKSGLSPGGYSLRLRSNTGADPIGSDVTVDNSAASASLTADEAGTARGTQTFTLTVTRQNDTRLLDGMAAVLSLEGGAFPEGAAVRYGAAVYTPSGGKVFVPLSGGGPHTLVLDASHSAGLTAGTAYTLKAEIYPTGYSAGEVEQALVAASTDFTPAAEPAYGLHVSIGSGSSRVVQAGGTIALSVACSVQNAASARLTVGVQKKADGAYQDFGAEWTVSGADGVSQGTSTQTVTVTVPDVTVPGTYRLLLRLGDRTAPYNLIVSAAGGS